MEFFNNPKINLHATHFIAENLDMRWTNEGNYAECVDHQPIAAVILGIKKLVYKSNLKKVLNGQAANEIELYIE